MDPAVGVELILGTGDALFDETQIDVVLFVLVLHKIGSFRIRQDPQEPIFMSKETERRP